MTKPCRDRKLNSWETIMSEVHWSALDALLYLTTSNQISPDTFLVLATNWRSDLTTMFTKFWSFHYCEWKNS
jgi:hypothetical protein